MITTYDSNCSQCLDGQIHSSHDDGKPTTVDSGDKLEVRVAACSPKCVRRHSHQGAGV